jgi:carotenoid cleavage dioxygenase-like enzyme
MAEAAQDRLRIVDPAANPYLSGRFAPVDRETDADDLQVEGTLPADIDGVFMRNGPNPKFPPLGSYTYPLEGDGMIHAVWIGGGARPGTETGGSGRTGCGLRSGRAAPCTGAS